MDSSQNIRARFKRFNLLNIEQKIIININNNSNFKIKENPSIEDPLKF